MVIISGPSTIGKNPLIYRICEEFDYHFEVPWTTRKMRKEEKDKIDYHFIHQTEFQQKIKNNEMNYWDYCLGNYYGFSTFNFLKNNIITHSLSRMAIRIKHLYPSKVKTVFLMPNNINEIIDRLDQIYSGEQLFNRIQLVHEEITHACLFDTIQTIQSRSTEVLDNEFFLDILRT
jgi:guanylate kinase